MLMLLMLLALVPGVGGVGVELDKGEVDGAAPVDGGALGGLLRLGLLRALLGGVRLVAVENVKGGAVAAAVAARLGALVADGLRLVALR